MSRPSRLHSQAGREKKESGSQASDAIPLRPASVEVAAIIRPSSPKSQAEPPRNLWSQAYELLRKDKKDLVEKYELVLAKESNDETTNTHVRNSPQRQKQMADLVERKLAAMRDKEWKISVRGKPVEVRKQVDRVLKNVLAAKDFVSSVASMDQVHAGIPWAGVCMLLPLLVNDSKQRTAAIDGLETITQITHRYASVEKIYFGGDEEALEDDLRETIVKLYKGILEYQGRAVCQFQRRTALQLARNIVTIDDWSSIIDAIKSADKACE